VHIDLDALEIVAHFDQNILGKEIISIRHLSKRHVLSLNSNLSYFMLSNIFEGRRLGGYHLRNIESCSIGDCIMYEATSKGSRVLVAGLTHSFKVPFITVLKGTERGLSAKSSYTKLSNNIHALKVLEFDKRTINVPLVLIGEENSLIICGLEKYDLVTYHRLGNIFNGKTKTYSRNIKMPSH